MQRKNGRAANSLREIRFETGYTRHAEGSVLASFGETRVLCTATLEEKVPSFLRGSGWGWITAEYGMLPRSTHTRNDREAARGKQSGRTLEIQRLIGRSLRMSVPLDLLGERQVILDCDVIQADGGTRTAAISGAWVALSLALDAARAKGVIANNLVVRPVAGVSVGRVNGKLMLDLDYEEDSTAEVDLNVVAAAPRIVEVQGTAEREPFERAELDAMLDLALEGIEELHLAQIEALRLAGVKMEGLK